MTAAAAAAAVQTPPGQQQLRPILIRCVADLLLIISAMPGALDRKSPMPNNRRYVAVAKQASRPSVHTYTGYACIRGVQQQTARITAVKSTLPGTDLSINISTF